MGGGLGTGGATSCILSYLCTWQMKKALNTASPHHHCDEEQLIILEGR